MYEAVTDSPCCVKCRSDQTACADELQLKPLRAQHSLLLTAGTKRGRRCCFDSSAGQRLLQITYLLQVSNCWLGIKILKAFLILSLKVIEPEWHISVNFILWNISRDSHWGFRRRTEACNNDLKLLYCIIRLFCCRLLCRISNHMILCGLWSIPKMSTVIFRL